MESLSSRVINGDQRAIARLITLVENDQSKGHEVMRKIHAHTGKAQVIGITGVMGCGKSTLIFELTKWYRKQVKPLVLLPWIQPARFLVERCLAIGFG